MRYRSTALIVISTVFLSSPTHTNGQPGPLQQTAKIAVLNGPPDLAVTVTANQELLVGSATNSISELATLSISISNRLTQRSDKPLMLLGSDASPVTLRVTLPAEGTLFQVGNVGVDSGFTCKTINNNVLCTGGTIAAGRQVHISVDVAGSQQQCSALAPATVEVDPTQNEVNQTNNTATTYVHVVNIC
jgi:hypothetical protein